MKKIKGDGSMWICNKCGGQIIMQLTMVADVSVEIGKNGQPIKLAKEEKTRKIIDLVKRDWDGEYCSYYTCEKCGMQKRAGLVEDYVDELDKIARWERK